MTSEQRRAEVFALEDQLDRIHLRLAQLANETAVSAGYRAPGIAKLRHAVNLLCTAELWLLDAAKEMKQ